tara:strand:- start:264 stop:785 length:522 start_codon:yes stop_codon:yes gene_type:complete
MKYLIISASLNPNSRSRVMGSIAEKNFKNKGEVVEFLDIKNIELPYCDGDDCYNNPNVKLINKKIKNADCILICSPIYNYDLNSVIKNILELSCRAWENKKVGFICAAGGYSSYMSPMSFMNSLMLDYRCLIIPRYVYATGKDFDGISLINSDIKDRIQDLVENAINITAKLA